MPNNEVRIIGGKWKGRKLRFPDSAGLRPTPGRVRGTLCNWLNADFQGASCLDLYAGSGALGFEALSRGAAQVVFVERNRKVGATLKRNAALLDANARVVITAATRFLATGGGPWELIFLDPPFASNELPVVLDLIVVHELLVPHGQVYFERPRKETLDTGKHGAGWRALKHSRAGDSQFGLLARQ